ncbi:MAG: hypothetical protein QOG23_4160 [Blastocatellia bacterium]|nr:hypothetical protein [Blastocatellia bacterium]
MRTYQRIRRASKTFARGVHEHHQGRLKTTKSVKGTVESTDNEVQSSAARTQDMVCGVTPPMNRWAIFGRRRLRCAKSHLLHGSEVFARRAQADRMSALRGGPAWTVLMGLRIRSRGGAGSLWNRLQQIGCQFWVQCLQNVVLLHRAVLFAGPNINYAQRMLREDVPGFELDNFAQQLDRFL